MKTELKSIQEQWEEYLQMVVPKNATEMERHHAKMGFYGGVHIMLKIQQTLTEEEVTTSQRQNITQNFIDEMESFYKSMGYKNA